MTETEAPLRPAGPTTSSGEPDEAAWLRLVERALAGRPFADLLSQTEEGLRIEPLTGATTRPAIGGRGAWPWQRLQRIDHPDAGAANEAALEALEGGATGLSLVFAGAPSARGFGIDPDALEDVLAGVRIDGCAVRLETGADGAAIAGGLASLIRRQRLDPALLELSLGVDPIGQISVSGSGLSDWPAQAPGIVTLVRDLAASGHVGPWLAADGRRAHEAGADAATELAVVTATALAYLRVQLDAAIAPETALRSAEFVLAVDADLFAGIAKLRAARLLWARLLAAASLPSVPLRLHAETSYRMLTRRDVQSNLVRNTIAAFAAGAGGANSLVVLPFSAALGLPDADARRLALNVQSLLVEEAHLGRIADPAAGAGSIEALTEALAKAAWDRFRQIEIEGGMPTALRGGGLQARIAGSREARRARIASGAATIVGVTSFQAAEAADPVVAESLQDIFGTEAEPLPSLRTAADFEEAGG